MPKKKFDLTEERFFEILAKHKNEATVTDFRSTLKWPYFANITIRKVAKALQKKGKLSVKLEKREGIRRKCMVFRPSSPIVRQTPPETPPGA